MTLQIQRPAFSSFLKAEVAEFANKAIDIVDNQNADELLISPVFEPLKKLRPEIDLLSIRYGTDPHRARIELLKSKLMRNVSSLKLKVRLLSKGGIDEDLHAVKSVIDNYLRYLSAPKKNDKVVVQQVQGFLNEMDTNADFSKGLAAHDLISTVSTIEEALAKYREAIQKRLEFRAQRPAVYTSQIVAKVRDAVHTLFKGIEVAQLINSELDYEPLVDELNELVSNYRLSARLRTAYNRRKAEEQKANNPQEDEPILDEEGNPIEEDGSFENEEQMMPTSTRSSNNRTASYGFPALSLTNNELLEEDDEEEEVDVLEEEMIDDFEEE